MHISFKEMMQVAKREHYAVGLFEAWDLYSVEAVSEAAEELNIPVVIGFGESVTNADWNGGGGIERLGALGKVVAQQSAVPMALIFNEAVSHAHCIKAIKAGFNAVMLDSSRQPYEKHLLATKALVREAHSLGAAVEAELGELPSASSVGEMHHSDRGELTDPKQAAQFVQETEIDALSVSVGNVHLLTSGPAVIDMERLRDIHQTVDVPLVLHGGTSLLDQQIPQAIEYGVAKVNVGTILKVVFYQGMAEAMATNQKNVNIHELMGSRRTQDILWQGSQRMKQEVMRRMRVYASRAGN